MKKILITTGGTGGHIYPALAIADELKKNNEIIFVGTKHRMEKDILPAAGYKFYGLDVLPLKKITSIIKLFFAILEAIRIIKTEKIDYVIGFGNYISIPSLVAAKILGIKIYLQEQNVSMGLANKWMYPYAEKIFLAFPETLNSINLKYKNKFVITGNPIRKEFYEINRNIAREKLNILENKKVITIMGGSLGAKNINEAILNKYQNIKEKDIILFWSTGKELYKDIVSRVEKHENIKIYPYFEDSYNIMSASDLIFCRAGASTISEIIELEKPSILIPYNFVGQKENAEILEIINSAKVYSNEEVENAIDEALRLVKDEDRLNFMKEGIKKIKPGNAIENICNYFK